MSHPFTRRIWSKNKKKKHPLHGRWCNIKQMVNNSNNIWYHTHGGLGVRMCKDWNDSYPKFLLWGITNGYEEGKVLTRTDNTKDYNPSNCKFV